MGHGEHHEKSRGPAGVYIVTVSDTRTPETDKSGDIIRDRLEVAGHNIVGRAIVRDEPSEIEAVFKRLPAGTQAVIFNGGTGISRRDNTYDVLRARLDKILPGFGELFRMLSYGEIGPAAIMSRAVAGVSGGLVVISVPGSSGAVTLAMDRIITPELAHMVWEAGR